MLVDENLDYGGSRGQEVVVMSGSRMVKDILTALPSDAERRILALVRSANDATSDLGIYMTRAHGFFPKVPVNKSRVQEILSPLWSERFERRVETDEEKVDNMDEQIDTCFETEDMVEMRYQGSHVPMVTRKRAPSSSLAASNEDTTIASPTKTKDNASPSTTSTGTSTKRRRLS